MANFKIFFLFICLTMYSVVVFPSSSMFVEGEKYAKVQEETMTILVRINNDSFTQMKEIPLVGYFDVYTILGERIKRIDLSKCKEGVDLELSKGLYILRAGKVTQKIVIR